MAKTIDKKELKRRMAWGLVSTLILVLADQLTKLLSVRGLKGQSDIRLLPGVLHLHYLENQSAAFSMDPVSLLQRIFHFAYLNDPEHFLMAKMIFFGIFTTIVILFLIYFYLTMPSDRKFHLMSVILIFLISGAIGNLIDRILHRYVVDFIYFCLIDFPVFNVADIYVTCAAIAFIASFLFYYEEEDLEVMMPFFGKSDKAGE